MEHPSYFTYEWTAWLDAVQSTPIKSEIFLGEALIKYLQSTFPWNIEFWTGNPYLYFVQIRAPYPSFLCDPVDVLITNKIHSLLIK